MPLVKLGVDEYKMKDQLLYMFEPLIPNQEKYVDSEHLSHQLLLSDVRHKKCKTLKLSHLYLD